MQFPTIWEGLHRRKPTGRFSNGRVPSDLIAESVGVKNILPAYLDPSLKSVLSLSDQLDLFKNT
ncbi:hypothetical protein GBA52_025283 [Prunus armeniaca]|nr:hypothetical protein GBA52_025283 [Prunus armeniaca]